jgi:hypothetical protein
MRERMDERQNVAIYLGSYIEGYEFQEEYSNL